MPKQDSRAERFGRDYYEHEKQASKGLAGEYGTGYGGKKLTRAEEKLIFMSRVGKDGKPGISDEEAQQMLAAGKSPEEVGMLMFPQREPLAKSGGRIEPKDVIDWVNKIADEIAHQELAMRSASGPSDVPQVSPQGTVRGPSDVPTEMSEPPASAGASSLTEAQP
jgi:hypothetical protein